MTFPEVVLTGTYASSADETGLSTVTLPGSTGDIQKDDLIFIFWAFQSDGGGPSRIGACYGVRGYHQLTQDDQGNCEGRIFYKAAHGNEAGQTIQITAENTTARIAIIVVVRGADIYTAPYCNIATAGASSTNPDAPSRTAPWGSADNLWIAFGCASGSAGFTGTPQNGDSQPYDGGIRVSASTTNPMSAALDWTQRAAATEDPTAWTRSSGNWKADTVVVRPAQTVNHPAVRGYAVRQVLGVPSTSNRDVTIPIVGGGAHRRMLLGIGGNDLQTSDTLTITLDPSGTPIVFSLVEDTLGNLAENDGAGEAGADGMRWYTSIERQDIAAGDYTLNVSGSFWPSNGTAHFFEIENTPTESVLVVGVASEFESSAGPVEFTVTGAANGLILALCRLGAANTWDSNESVIGGQRPGMFGDCGEVDVYNDSMLAFVGRSIEGTNTVHLELDPNTISRLGLAIALGFVPSIAPNPLFFGGF